MEGGIVQSMMEFAVGLSANILLPVMLGVFAFAVVARLVIYMTVKREQWFVQEFDKRVNQNIKDPTSASNNFYVVLKELLEKTYYEVFELRNKYKRRNHDHIMTVSDRLFLIQDGVARLIIDLLMHVRFLRKDDKGMPDFTNISKTAFGSNPAFGRIFGIVPINLVNDTLNLLPGIFIIGGIFGTFLGIMRALPELGGIDVTNAELSKVVMDDFLIKISFAMSTSIVGIVLSVMMNFLNTVFSAETVFYGVVNSFRSSLDILWHRSQINDARQVQHDVYGRDNYRADATQAVSDAVLKHFKKRPEESPTIVHLDESDDDIDQAG